MLYSDIGYILLDVGIAQVHVCADEEEELARMKQVCPIWGAAAEVLGSSEGWLRVYSPRAGGTYEISEEAADDLPAHIDVEGQIKLSWMVVDSEYRSQIFRFGTVSEIEAQLKKEPSRSPLERSEWLLRFFVMRSEWLGLTISFQHEVLETDDYLQLDSLVRRRAYTAVKRVSKATARGKGNILSAVAMDASYSDKNQAYKDSVGASLNIGVNELTDVLHTFYLNVVDEEDS